MTPFGVPVEPEVYKRMYRLSGLGDFSATLEMTERPLEMTGASLASGEVSSSAVVSTGPV
jgi:hypothetical protein